MKRALIVGHDHVAGIEHLGGDLERRGFALDRLPVVPEERFARPDVTVEYPDPRVRDLVVTLGAPWPRDRIAGWTRSECAFLRRAHDGGGAVLGVCLGAQLLAEALGAATVPLRTPRIGWFPVTSHSPLLDPGPWFTWHAEQVTVPPGAEVLAESADGVEAFRLGRSLGIQFHREMTPRLLDRWLDLPGGPPDGIDVAALRAATRQHAPRAAAKLLADEAGSTAVSSHLDDRRRRESLAALGVGADELVAHDARLLDAAHALNLATSSPA